MVNSKKRTKKRPMKRPMKRTMKRPMKRTMKRTMKRQVKHQVKHTMKHTMKRPMKRPMKHNNVHLGGWPWDNKNQSTLKDPLLSAPVQVFSLEAPVFITDEVRDSRIPRNADEFKVDMAPFNIAFTAALGAEVFNAEVNKALNKALNAPEITTAVTNIPYLYFKRGKHGAQGPEGGLFQLRNYIMQLFRPLIREADAEAIAEPTDNIKVQRAKYLLHKSRDLENAQVPSTISAPLSHTKLTKRYNTFLNGVYDLINDKNLYENDTHVVNDTQFILDILKLLIRFSRRVPSSPSQLTGDEG
jgi:hypothetical protein